MSYRSVAGVLAGNPPLCRFIINDSDIFSGRFLGMWSDEFANVCVDEATMQLIWSFGRQEGGDDFEMVRRADDGLFYLMGQYAVTLVEVDLDPSSAARVIHAACICL